MEKKGKKVSDKELNEMLERVEEVLKEISERPGMVPFGIIMRMDENGMAGSPVCNFGDSNEYWQKLSFGLGVMLSQGGPFRVELLTTVVSAMELATRTDPVFAGLVRDVLIPRLKDAADGKGAAVKITVPNGKGGPLS